MEQLYKPLARAENKAMEWRERNHVVFDNSKNEMIVFTRQRKVDLRKQLAEARIAVREHTTGFNVEARRLLGVYLDTGLQFLANKNVSLEKVKRVKERVWRLGSTHSLEPELIRQV